LTNLCCFFGGKDSITLVRSKSFFFPFPLLHVDTGHNFPETIEFRDKLVGTRIEPIVNVQDAIDQGKVVEETGKYSSRNSLTTTPLDAIEEFKFDACIGGARRDEEKARAKERIFRCVMILVNGTKKISVLNYRFVERKIENGQTYVFSISNWTEARCVELHRTRAN
jgi:sulfate adenylyltransferase subunit 2